ncbi:unnamed protein product, partial [Ectocarpus sp. 8 AP-2014]
MSQLEESVGKDGVEWRGVDTWQAADSFFHFFHHLKGVCSEHVPPPPPLLLRLSPEQRVAVRISPLVSVVHHLGRLLPFRVIFFDEATATVFTRGLRLVFIPREDRFLYRCYAAGNCSPGQRDYCRCDPTGVRLLH